MKEFKSIVNLYRILILKRKLQGIACLLLMILSAISESIVIFSLSSFLSIISGNISSSNFESKPFLFFFDLENNSLYLVSLVFISAVLISTIIRLSTAFLNAFYSAAISHDLSKSIYIKSIRTPYHIHINKNSTGIISLISTHLNQATDAINYTLVLFTGFFTTLSILLSLSTINGKILLYLIIIFTFIYLLLGLSAKKILSNDSIIIAESINRQINIAKESLFNLKDVIVYNLFNFYKNNYYKTDFNIRYRRARGSIISQFPKYIIEGLGIIALTLFILLIEKSSLENSNIFPIIGAFALGAQRLLPSLQQIYTSWARIKLSLRSLDYLYEEIKKPTNFYTSNKLALPKKIRPLDSIEFKNICYSYKGDKNCLKNISFKIQKGESLGIIGESGCGKSTLLDLILGLLKHQKGEILYNRKNFLVDDNEMIKKTLAMQYSIAHVSQNFYLIDGTIKENICFGIKENEIKENFLRKVLLISQLENLISKLPLGLNTNVGENGIKLSGGERQRIAIARALYRKPNLLILDEATSALDKNTEKKLIQEIYKYSEDKILIIVAHRISTIESCDSYIRLSNGEIVNQGSPKEIN